MEKHVSRAPVSNNFFWTHPTLDAVDYAHAFYQSSGWHNFGGDRTWLSPEVDFFIPNFPSFDTYFQPREFDPGTHELTFENGELALTNLLPLKVPTEIIL